MMGVGNIGQMRERIDILTRDAIGQDWRPSGSIMGELIPDTGKEVQQMDSVQPYGRVRFRTRYRRALADADTRTVRLKCRGRLYDVIYIEDVMDQHAQLYIVCEVMT